MNSPYANSHLMILSELIRLAYLKKGESISLSESVPALSRLQMVKCLILLH